MKCVRTLCLAAAALLLPAAALPGAERQPPLRVLLLTGQNNHNWKQTTPALKRILTVSRRFTVEVNEQPEQCAPEALRGCDVVLSNWNALGPVKTWPEPFRNAVLEFVRNGGGFVVVHAGGTMFHDWPDFQKMIGATWGRGTGHGAKHSFEVKFTDPQHPITQGLAPFKITDELWHRMDAQSDKKILATAFSAPEKGGSGNDEPMVMSTQFGKGRCFNLVLGHDLQAIENPNFQTLLLRGTEWAATAQVTIASASAMDADPEELLEAIAGYRFGDSRSDVVALEKHVGAVSRDAAASRALAAKLAAMLDRQATVECKQIVCRQLSVVGGVSEVPALARRLGDKDLGFYARFALERIPGAESLAALRDGLKTVQGKLKAGLIGSLGARRDAESIPALAVAVADPDRVVGAAAIDALGMIGGRAAVETLRAAKASLPAALHARLAGALVRSTQGLPAAEALPLLEKLDKDSPPAVRTAAFLARVGLLGEKADEAIQAALFGPDPTLQAAAVRALSRHDALLAAVAVKLGGLPPTIHAQVLTLLAERRCAAALPAALQAIASKEPEVRRAAIAALGALGNASTAATLVGLLEGSDQDEQKAIGESLARLRDPAASEAIVAAMGGAGPGAQVELIRAVVARGATQAVPALLAAAGSKTATVRQEAIIALGKLSGPEDGLRVLELLDKLTDPAALQPAIVAIYSRGGDPAPVVALAQKATGPRKALLVTVLGWIGGEKPLEAVRGALKAEDAEVRMAAIRALANWPDAAPLEDLLAIASAEENLKAKVLVLRGIARQAPLAKDQPRAKVAEVLAKAMGLATRPDEVKVLLAALVEAPSPAGLKAALPHLKDVATRNEAAMAVVKIATGLRPSHRAEVAAAIEQVRAVTGDVTFFAVSEKVPAGENLARGAKATNLDGLRPDGQGGGPAAAIDGNPDTYWDETDNQKLYWLCVHLKSPATVTALRITAFGHHAYAPRDFEILCDNQVVKKVVGAIYQDRQFGINLPPTTCVTVQLKITGSYGASPGIRELEILGKSN